MENKLIFLFNFKKYLFISFLLCLTIYLNTIHNQIYSININDVFGLFRTFPSDIDIFIKTSDEDFLIYHRNLFPSILIWFFNSNFLLIFICQFLIYQILIYKLLKITESNFLLFFIYIYISINTIFPNKDIFTIYTFLILVIFSIEKTIKWIILSLIFCLATRPELLILILIFIIFCIFIKYFNIIFIFLISLVSLLYNFIPRRDEYNQVLINTTNDYSISLILNNLISDYFLYWLLFPLKIISSIIDGGLLNIILFSFLLIYALFKFEKTYLYALLILSIIYSTIVSFSHFRYLIPIYIILVTIYSLKSVNKKN